MPEIGITRELSVGEVNQIQHRRNVIIISILTLVFLGAFFISLRDLAPAYAIGIVFMLGFFLLSFINIRIGFVLIVLAFLLSPEINLPMAGLRNFTIRAEDLLIIVVLLAWLGRLAMGLQKNFFINTSLNLPILLIIVWNIICSWRAASLNMVNPDFCLLTNLKITEFFVLYFVIVNNLNDIREVKFMFYLLMMTVLIIGLYAALQIPKTQVFTTNRLTAPFEGKPEPNTLGAYLTIFFGMALSIFIYARPSGLRRLCAILAVLLPLPIMFTYSRSAYLVIIVIVIFLTIVSRRRWLIFTVVTFFILSPFILPKSVINRAIYNFTNARYHGFLDPSAAERVGVYDKAWDNIKRYTIFGRGVGADGGIIDSQYARVIIETGLFGLILFLWLLFRLLKLGIRLFRVLQEGWVKGAALGFVAVVVGAIFHCYGNVTFCIVRIAEPFWALAGLIAYSLYYINANRDNPKALELAK